MGKLREQQGDDMAPTGEGSGLLGHLGGAGNLGHQKLRNEVANLPQQVQF